MANAIVPPHEIVSIPYMLHSSLIFATAFKSSIKHNVPNELQVSYSGPGPSFILYFPLSIFTTLLQATGQPKQVRPLTSILSAIAIPDNASPPSFHTPKFQFFIGTSPSII
ncbi:hypothetical protein ES703_92274 [subsurface metagenome]